MFSSHGQHSGGAPIPYINPGIEFPLRGGGLPISCVNSRETVLQAAPILMQTDVIAGMSNLALLSCSGSLQLLSSLPVKCCQENGYV